MATVLLLGMDSPAAQSLGQLLVRAGNTVLQESIRTEFMSVPHADLVVLNADYWEYLSVLRAIRAQVSAPPVVVVTSRPQISRWLDALEVGAADYCAEPFDKRCVQRMLNLLPTSQANHLRVMAA